MRSSVIALALLVLAGCGGESEVADKAKSGAENGAEAGSEADVGGEEPAVNLLTLAEGAILVSSSRDPHEALSLTDGADGTNWSNGGPRHVGPFSFVFEMRAPTQLTRVGAEGAGARPGGVLGGSAKTVRIEASAEGPESGFEEIGRVDVVEEGETLISANLDHEVRWLRFTIESNHSGADWTYLDGVSAYGAQTPPNGGDRFTGVFQVGRNGLIELKQSGGSIAGCYLEQGGHGAGKINGAVVDGVARLQWRSEDGIGGPALMVLDAGGNLSGVRYRDRSRTAWGGPPAPEGATAPCSTEAAPVNPIADALQNEGEARIYGILFDFDEATLTSSSGPALNQLLQALQANASLSVDIEGHTDALGDGDYNLSLSEQRAHAVVQWLVDHGVSASRLNSVGKGESEPVASNDTADGRALNRRVEVARR